MCRGMAKDSVGKVAKTEPERTFEAHAMRRADGGWQLISAQIPESVYSKYATFISDIDTFGNQQNKLEKALWLQKERG